MTSDVTVTIDRLGHLGDGIASGPVFVPRTLPGEVVEGEVIDGRIAAPRIVQPSPQRVAAPCRHYKTCGGCSLQHARNDFVSEWKCSVVTAALAANDLPAPIRRVHTSPPASRRRAVFSGKRTKSGAMVGFHRAESDTIVAVPDCRVITPRIAEAFGVLEALVVLGGTRKGEVKLAVTDCVDGLDVSASGGRGLDAGLLAEVSTLVAGSSIARLTWNGEPVLQKAQPRIDLDGVLVPFPAGAFLQATEAGEAALRAAVGEAVGDAKRIVDLFAGLGTFALPLARGAEILAVEGERTLIDALEAGWRSSAGLKRVQGETRDLFRRPLLSDELRAFDAIVIDPPRSGAAAQVNEIGKSGVPRVAHVSCNPVTFARDARTLVESGYSMAWIDIVDQFRWSNHTELVSLFEIKRS